MNKAFSARNLAVAALLIAIGILIPAYSPLKIVLEPASFTLASHVPIFIAMLLVPDLAAAVAAGTALGFFVGGFPPVIVLRAATHVVFAAAGGWWLKRHPALPNAPRAIRLFSFIIALIHAACEVMVVSIFFFGGDLSGGYYDTGFFTAVLLLVGIGTVVHSMVDFELALLVRKALPKELK